MLMNTSWTTTETSSTSNVSLRHWRQHLTMREVSKSWMRQTRELFDGFVNSLETLLVVKWLGIKERLLGEGWHSSRTLNHSHDGHQPIHSCFITRSQCRSSDRPTFAYGKSTSNCARRLRKHWLPSERKSDGY